MSNLSNYKSNENDDLFLPSKKNELIVSDQKEALNALSMDKEFIEKLIVQRTLKEMQELFMNRGVILSEEEIDAFIEMVKASSSKQELPDEFFEDAAAGVLNNQGTYKLVHEIANTINQDPSNKGISKSVLWI